ncbi:GNAT family N-acetyltransferase [Streptomyces pactum]|uniref:GNAT family N-acetyltransferase n=1 Tax=Streptomyces pactum TaxID=68249 RepID=A0ABS0NJC1_9ACTN|nr:GNAT family N-acetyltransferase [Streptomyces pactum]MBH5335293.1 GNAT family N-acetyltransferase [Streptomyces pactum]
MAHEISVARREHLRELSDVLARAFQQDPVACWTFPDPETRRRSLPKVFAAMLRHQHLRHGACEFVTADSGRIIGSALWDPPGRWKQTLVQQLISLPAYARAAGRGAARAAAMVNAMEKVHPSEPHWYLAVIGTDPDPRFRGKGHGAALMRSRLERCDRLGLPAYLEASDPENVPYYERFGFEVTGILPAPAGAPRVPTMWRRPGAS